MNVILTGASGTAGSQVLRQLLPNPAVGHVTVLSRSPQLPDYVTSTLPVHDSAKLSVLEHRDFSAYPSELLSRAGVKDAGAVIWALGVSANDVDANKYTEITHDYTMAAAEAMRKLDKPPRFVFLSGQGATQDEQSRQLFGRIKGRTEKHLTEMLGDRAYHFRPPFISPVVPRPSERAKLSERVMDAVTPLFGLLLPQVITRTDTLAAAMINVALNGAPGESRVFDRAAIERLATSVGSF